MTHKELLMAASEAIGSLFGDTSVPRHETAESLQVLLEEIERLLEAVDDDENDNGIAYDEDDDGA